MVRLTALALLLAFSAADAWLSGPQASCRRATRPFSTLSTPLRMAIDYKDPMVADEYAKVQPMAFEDVEEELMAKGIPVPASMNEMDAKLMLVEMRLRFAGKLGNNKDKKRPTKFTSKFEEAMWTKPAFKEFYNAVSAKGDINALNAVTEYLNNKEQALQRYGKDYRGLLRQIDEALTAPPPVKSPTLQFSGFPANLGEMGCKMTLETLGAIAEFECQQDEDFPILRGKVTYEDIESAKKAVAQYHGMNMGMGATLELISV